MAIEVLMLVPLHCYNGMCATGGQLVFMGEER